MDNIELRKIAKIARRKAINLYHKDNLYYLETKNKSEGCCGIWSYIFIKILATKNVKASVIRGSVKIDHSYSQPHYWVKCGKYFCDGTGDQFQKLPKISIKQYKKINERYIRPVKEKLNMIYIPISKKKINTVLAQAFL